MNFAERFDSKLSHDSPVSITGERFSIESKPVFVHTDLSKAIIVPDAHLLFSGEYTRIGNDLIISGQDQKFVVGNYFKGETRPALTSTDGSTLSGHIIDALTGHVHYAQAGAPVAAQVIGHVLKLSGSASAIRNGVSVELHIGDAVQKGDVIQTGSDSSIGLTFVDGSAFGMTSNARMVLNEMIFDPNGSSNSSLISLVQGTITFVAGQTAKNGNMRVETPVATMGIRGTAVLVEIASNDGPTKFSVLVEPDGHTGSYNLYDKVTGQLIGTVSQAGQVTFVSSLGVGQPPSAVEQLKTMQDQQAEKAIIQQVFQLYFPNYNPDANPKTMKFGSTSGNNLAEIIIGTATFNGQTAISQIELRFAPAEPNSGGNNGTNRVFYNAKASFSTEAVHSSQSFGTQPDSFKLGDFVKISDPDIGNAPFYDIPTPFIPGTATILSAVSTTTAPNMDALKNLLHIDQTTGQVSFDRQDFNFLDDGQTVNYIIRVKASSGPDSEYVLIHVTFTGANDPPIFSNPIPVAAELHEIGIVAPATVPPTNGDGVLQEAITLHFTDADYSENGSNYTVQISSVSTSGPTGGFDASTLDSTLRSFFTFATAPVTKDLNQTDAYIHGKFSAADKVFDYLADGEKLVITYTVALKEVDQSTPVYETFTVTIVGSNDVPTITAGANQTDTIYEVPNQTGGTGFDTNVGGHTPEGSITFADVDLSDRPDATIETQTIVYKSATGQVLNTLTDTQIAAIKAAFVLEQSGSTNNGVVKWTYKLPDNVLDFMSQGETIELVSNVQIDDHHGGKANTTVTINIVGGANDTPEITSVTGLALTELPTALHDTVTANFTDVDLTQTGHTASVLNVAMTGVVPPGTTPGQVYTSANAFLALLTVAAVVKNSGDSTGYATFNFDAGPGVFDYLAKDEVVTLTYAVGVTDSNSASDTNTVTITVKGTNDAPVIDTIAATTLNETTDTSDLTLATPVHVTFTDVDLSDVGHTASITDVATDGVTTGLALTPQQLINLVTPISIDKAAGSSAGTVDLGFSASSTAFDYLAAGESLKLTYTLTVSDGDGGITSKTFDVTIKGTNDDAIISVAAGNSDSGNVKEDDHAVSETASGTLSFSDADLTDVHEVSIAPVGTPLGTMNALKMADTSGGTGGQIAWSYSVDNSAIQYLAAGEQKIETFTISLFDGHNTVTKDVSVTITGTNDAPVIAVDMTGTDSTNVHDIPETNDGLTASGTLAVSDVDVTNTVAASVVSLVVSGEGASGLPSALDNAALKAMFSVDVGDVISNTETTGTIHWSFDSAGNPFDFLADGEKLTLTYIVRATDSDTTGATGDQTVVVQITGTNDAPVIAAALTDYANEGDAPFPRDLLTDASDPDHGDSLNVDHLTYAVGDGDPSSVIPAGLVLSSDGHTLTIDPQSTAFNSLVQDEQLKITVTYDVIDNHGTATPRTETITITGTNDAPAVNADNFIVSSDAFDTSGTPTLTIADALLLLNDTDAEGQTLTVSDVGDSSGGTVTHSSTDVVYSIDTLPEAGGHPTYSFQYTVADSANASNVGMANLTILGPDEANPAHHTLTGTEANETFIGGPGADTFVFTANSGNDTIANFQPNIDQVVLNDYGDPFGSDFAGWLATQVTDTANGALIHLDANNSITLTGVTKASLTASDFIIHPGGGSA